MAKKMKKLFALLLALSMIMGLMSISASAADTTPPCGYAYEHNHSEECYQQELVCSLHAHIDACYSEGGELSCTEGVKELTCLKKEHAHDDSCKHIHVESCYVVDCEEEHDHAAGCYVLNCSEELDCTEEVYAHSADCYADHSHGAACYADVRICEYAEEHRHTDACYQVAQIGDEKFTSLADAVAAANADTTTEGAVEIKLIKDITVGAAMTVKRDITISGAHTITRGVVGTMITVNAGKTLTLDGGIVIDGNNNWTFDSVNYYADMAADKTLSTGAKNSYTTSEEGGLVATNAMFTVKGAVVMNNATIQNNWGSTLFSIPSADAVLTMNAGANIQHIRGWVVSKGSSEGLKGTWTMNGGKIDDVFGHNTNGALVDIRGGTFTINGGELTNIRTLGLNANGNGLLAQVYGESSKMNINGGWIHGNASFAPGGGWGAVVYLNRGGDFTMTGGIIEDTITNKCTAFVSNSSTSIELLGGTIEIDPSTAAAYDGQMWGNVTIAKDMDIILTADAYNFMRGSAGNTLVVNGEISGGLIRLLYNEPVTGKGTVTSDVLIQANSYFDGNATIAEANWLNSVITVNAVDAAASLTVGKDAVIDGKQVRVLNSVASGAYTNAAEAAAAQAAAYVKEDGATVESPVLYYHRLTSAQKSNIVVTFDYNGGLDAQGWSGCQLTGEETFAPALPSPTKAGLKLAGWTYATDSNPESLSMEGDVEYNGEEITESVRLIAQWKEVKPVVRPNPPVEEELPEGDVPATDSPIEEEEIVEDETVEDEEIVEDETVEIEDEDIPLADVPETGDMTALWAAASVVSAAGMLFLGKKNKDEE